MDAIDIVLAATPVSQSILGALIPAGISLLGGLFKGKGKQKEEQAAWEANRPQWEREEAVKAARAQLVSKILGGLGIGGSIDPALLSRLGTAQPFPNRPSGGWQGAVGGALSGVAPYLYRSMNPEQFGAPGDTPGTDAAEAGGVYGPPVPPPSQVNPETIARGQQPDDEYSNLFRGISGVRF
jgi:hypothetical protein